MNPKHIRVRMDPATGDLWLTEERYRKPIKRVANITQHIYLALCADLVLQEGTTSVERDIKFSDGFSATITIKTKETENE